MKYGFINVAAAVPAIKVADVDYNVQQIESLMAQAEGKGVEILVTPELCITGYSCQDLFREQLLLDKSEEGILQLLDFTRKLDTILVVGAPVLVNSLLYNCAVIIQRGQRHIFLTMGSSTRSVGLLLPRILILLTYTLLVVLFM